MNEKERAKRLCDAIDAMLQGGQPELDLDDPEFIELLRIARLRHSAGEALADVGLAYQELLRRILQSRLMARQMEQNSKADDLPPEVEDLMSTEDPREFLEPLDPDHGKLLNFLDFLPGAPQSVPSTSQPQPRTRTVVLPRPRRSDRDDQKAEALTAGLDCLISSRKRDVPVDDPDLAELIEVAQLRQFVGESLAAVGAPYKRRLWTVLRLRLAASIRRQSYAADRPSIVVAIGQWSWQRAAAVAAGIALLAAVLGPLPATGFADHPATRVFDFVTQRVGIEEVSGPPPAQVPSVSPEEVMPIDDAQLRLGIPLREPSYLPQGLQLARSSYYPQGIPSPEQGMFVLSYTPGGVVPSTIAGQGKPELIIYQEKASLNAWGVQSDEAEDVLIRGSVPATYARALWVPGEQGTLEGVDANAESLFFDDSDVRIVITYKNGGGVREELLRIAESMLAQ